MCCSPEFEVKSRRGSADSTASTDGSCLAPNLFTIHQGPWSGVIGEVLILLGRDTANRRVAVDRQLAGDLPAIMGDRLQLQHLFFNLFVNALEAMDSIGDRAKVLCVTSQRDGSGDIIVEIRDTGIGLPDPDRAFEPFFSTKPNGMGMGLSICRSIVEVHQGYVWAVPSDAPGTTLCVRLPLNSDPICRSLRWRL
jgi:signal transduction histidine kinase